MFANAQYWKIKTKRKTSLSIEKKVGHKMDFAIVHFMEFSALNVSYSTYGISLSPCLFSASLSLSPPAECRGLQYEHPHARSPCEFLSGHSVPGPEGCRAAGEAHLRTWCGLLTNGYQGEPLAADCDRCEPEEGRNRQTHWHWPAGLGSEVWGRLKLHCN